MADTKEALPELPSARVPDDNGAGWFTAGQMLTYGQVCREAGVSELRAEVERLRVDADRWRKASTSRNLGIAFWGEHGQGVVYDQAAEIHTDRVIMADAARAGASGGAKA